MIASYAEMQKLLEDPMLTFFFPLICFNQNIMKIRYKSFWSKFESLKVLKSIFYIKNGANNYVYRQEPCIAMNTQTILAYNI